jgi:hypothetical protein
LSCPNRTTYTLGEVPNLGGTSFTKQHDEQMTNKKNYIGKIKAINAAMATCPVSLTIFAELIQ